MAERTCYNCVYCCCDPCLWLRLLWLGEPILPHCANHPQWPGQLHDVPGVPCRNYRPRPATAPGRRRPDDRPERRRLRLRGRRRLRVAQPVDTGIWKTATPHGPRRAK